MIRLSLAVALLAAACWCAPVARQSLADVVRDLGVTTRADASLVGYLTAVFLGDDPYVYFYLSEGNNPVAFSALNGGDPILKPTLGTGGVRDPAIVTGGGDEEGSKWYIIGTDLDIDKTTWSLSQRNGSRGIFVWESTDLVNWTGERLPIVEDDTAGMVWAPEAIWSADEGKYMVYWASKFYDESDTQHTGTASDSRIRYAYTSDFRTFSTPQTYVERSFSVIDLTVLPTSDNETFLRFIKDETAKTVFVEYSTTGLLGTWTRPGGDSAYIQSAVEGPAAYWDNQVDGKAHLLLDFYNDDGYRPYESTNPESNSDWTASNGTAFPTDLRHGSVLAVDAEQYAALEAAW